MADLRSPLPPPIPPPPSKTPAPSVTRRQPDSPVDTSKVYSHVYIHSLPDLEEIGRVFVGQHPEWVTFTPDGKTAYMGAAGDHVTYAVDVESMEVVAVIPVGQVPKRVAMVRMAVDG